MPIRSRCSNSDAKHEQIQNDPAFAGSFFYFVNKINDFGQTI